jgi:hypothetical protein
MRHALLLSSLFLLACGGGSRPDAGLSLADAPAADAPSAARDTPASRPDVPTSSDPCASDAAGSARGVGCNGGFVSGDPAANTAGGACTADADPMTNPAGTCTGANVVCAAEPSMMGTCVPLCMAGSTYVSTGGCPTGWRCFSLMAGGVCFRDCDATHPCAAGEECDAEGSCVPM